MTGFDHVGVRASSGQKTEKDSRPIHSHITNRSGVWHYARPCGHRVTSLPNSPHVKYNGGPLWKDGYTWQNVYWGGYFANPTISAWVKRIDNAVVNIENDASYSGALAQYNVGTGKFAPHAIIQASPAVRLSDSQVKQSLANWIAQGAVTNLGTQGAYNIFLPPGITVSLAPLELSCKVFCDYHNTVNNTKGPFYTVEPYPCSQGCNQCTNDPFDTLTQGLSEEMIELKTDMDPGTGWVIGNEEICDYCDANFICNRINTGEYVNAWYDRSKNACWIGQPSQGANPVQTDLGRGIVPVSG